jgi:hypothetical protein
MNNTAPYPGDVLEHALNRGINSAADRYHSPVEYVRGLVEQFASECEPNLDTRCPCDIAREQGSVIMCAFCMGPENTSRFRF